jgi:hypothetical protein
MAKSTYLETAILDHVLRDTAYTSPDTVYAALFTSNPGEDGSGNEVSGGSYIRQAVTFGAASGGSISNSAEIEFTGLPVATITHIAVYDAETDGNLLYYGTLSQNILATAGSTVEFATGNFSVSED